jgi:hypothetical protein
VSPPTYTLYFEDRPGYLYARVEAETIDAENALEYLFKVADRCDETKCERLMLERDIPVMLPPGDLFFTTQKFLERVKGIRVAFVNPHAPIREDMKFAIMIGTNRGAMYSLHDNTASAERWLESE